MIVMPCPVTDPYVGGRGGDREVYADVPRGGYGGAQRGVAMERAAPAAPTAYGGRGGGRGAPQRYVPY